MCVVPLNYIIVIMFPGFAAALFVKFLEDGGGNPHQGNRGLNSVVCLSKLEQNSQKICKGEKTVKLLDVYSQGTDSLEGRRKKEKRPCLPHHVPVHMLSNRQ